MVWWIIVAIVGLAVLLLLVVVYVVLARLREMRHVERALRRRADEALKLREPALALQRKVEAMQEQMAGIQRWLEARAARKAAESG